jgi:hypothetical protein
MVFLWFSYGFPRFEVLDLFSGRSVPTKGPSIDLRVALSAEVAVKDMPRPQGCPKHRCFYKCLAPYYMDIWIYT